MDVRLRRRGERLGATSVWLPEFWAHDALTRWGHSPTPPTRSGSVRRSSSSEPGPQRCCDDGDDPAGTVERAVRARHRDQWSPSDGGWHGVRFSRPVTRTRETIEIVRMVTRGERLHYDGEVYRLPCPEARAWRYGAPHRRGGADLCRIPGPANLRLTGALADGWIGNSFLCESAGSSLTRSLLGRHRRAGQSRIST